MISVKRELLQKEHPPEPQPEKKKKKKNRGPEELSSKVPVGRARNVIPASGIARRKDPRFLDSTGKFSASHFNKNYGFLQEIKAEETKDITRALKKAKTQTKQEGLKAALKEARLEKTEAKKQETVMKAKQQVKKVQQTKRLPGQKPFFLKKSEEKMLGLGAKFLELKQSGKLNKFMETRMRKKASKDHRSMPYDRRGA